MPKYKTDIYYTGFITIPVEADNVLQSIAIAKEEAARFHNKKPAEFAEEILGNLEVCKVAVTTVGSQERIKAVDAESIITGQKRVNIIERDTRGRPKMWTRWICPICGNDAEYCHCSSKAIEKYEKEAGKKWL